MIYDYAVIGSGIIGTSVAYNLQKINPRAKIIVLEKEQKPFLHQTSHNSGVIHSGVYYPTGSLKSKYCKLGLEKTYDYCKKNNINFKQCGKLIVATSKNEISELHNIYENGLKNEILLQLISKRKIKALEPNLKAYEAILSPKTGIIDWKEFGESLMHKFISFGGTAHYDFFVRNIVEESSYVSIIDKKNINIKARKMISCGGLQSDRLADMVGIKTNLKVIPFRGDYFKLNKKFNNLFNHLIYPVPDKNMPFLGIHFTKTLDNFLTLGPNATINFSRESYERFFFDFKDIADYIFYKGFWRLISKHKEFVFSEFLTSFFKFYYLQKCSKYYKGISAKDLSPYRSGIRAQAITNDGSLVNDFIFKNTEKCLFVLNAPSPAATSSLPIGETIARKILEI